MICAQMGGKSPYTTPNFWSVLLEYCYLHVEASESERTDHIADKVIHRVLNTWGGGGGRGDF